MTEKEAALEVTMGDFISFNGLEEREKEALTFPPSELSLETMEGIRYRMQFLYDHGQLTADGIRKHWPLSWEKLKKHNKNAR